MNDVVIRLATPKDVTPILEVLEDYLRESIYGELDCYNPEGAVLYTAQMVEHQYVIVAEFEGKIVGVVMCSVGYSFWTRKEMSVETFYVVPEWRGTELGRMFVRAIKEVIEKEDVMVAAVASTSGFGSRVEKQFTNMVAKEGFNPMGPACVYINRRQK